MTPTQPLLRKAIVAGLVLMLATTGLAAGSPAFADSQIKVAWSTRSRSPRRHCQAGRLHAPARVGRNLPQKAREELINEVLQREEIIRLGVSVSTDDVDAAFARFADNNKMSPEQLGAACSTRPAWVAAHFKAYIGVQMSWPRVVNIRYGQSAR